MTVTLPAPMPVDAPEATPPESGLVATVRKLDRLIEDTAHQHWEIGGYTYRPEAAGVGNRSRSVLGTAGVDVYREGIADDNDHGIVTAYPFILEADETCSMFGWTAANYQDRARRRLLALQSKIAEREFWTGELATADDLDPAEYQWLTNGNAVVDLTPAAGPVDPRHGMSIIEEGLGAAGTGAGFIHVTRRMGMLMPDRWSEGLLFSQLDSSVVLGSGYTGSGPDNAAPAPGTQWMIGTNVCNMRLGPIEVFPETLEEALDRGKNTLSFHAERFAAVSWDGNAHIAVQISLT